MPISVVVVSLVFYASLVQHDSHDESYLEFRLEKPYSAVASGIATKNSLERMVEQEEGSVTGREWIKFQVEVPQRLFRVREYGLSGEMKFNVTRPQDWSGTLPFVQKVKVDTGRFVAETGLAESAKSMPLCTTRIELFPDPASPYATTVMIRGEISISRKIFFFLRGVMDKRLKEYNERRLHRMKDCIMSITEVKSPVITFKRGD